MLPAFSFSVLRTANKFSIYFGFQKTKHSDVCWLQRHVIKFELILASNKTALPQLRMSSHYLLPYINMHCTTCNIHVDIHQTRVSNLI